MCTIQLTVDNQIGILEKITTVFTRNRVNIQQLELKDIPESEQSSIRVSADFSEIQAVKLIAQLKRIVEVVEAIKVMDNK